MVYRVGRERSVDGSGCEPNDTEVWRRRDHHGESVANAERPQAAHAHPPARFGRFRMGIAPGRGGGIDRKTLGHESKLRSAATGHRVAETQSIWVLSVTLRLCGPWSMRVLARTLRASLPIALAMVALAAGATSLDAQRGQGPAGPPPTPKTAAAIDLTGTWVSVISEDWALRMVTPAKGNYLRVPLTPAARKVADGWDPVKDEAAGEQCRGYGAAMR